jgi:methanogenic corrinoid protein MtbC1
VTQAFVDQIGADAYGANAAAATEKAKELIP